MKTTTLLLITIFAVSALGQNIKTLDQRVEYEPSAAFPYGRINPEAPKETKQFDFMIGSFECDDQIRNPANGKFFAMKALRGASYVLNGHAIQDKNYTPILASTNIRIYDPGAKEWIVSYFKAPFGTGVWKGKFQNGAISLWKGDEKSGSKLSFFDIKKDEYSWKAESYKDGESTLTWKFTCRRKKG